MGSFLPVVGKPWNTPETNEAIDKYAVFGMTLFTVFLGIGIWDLSGTLIEAVGNLSNVVTLGLLLVASSALMVVRGKPTFLGIGKTSSFVIAIIAGVGISLFVILLNNILVGSGTQSVLLNPQSIITQSQLTFIFNVINIPFVEEHIFGALLPFVLFSISKKNSVAILGTCSLFAIFHWWSYGASLPQMSFSFIFRFIILIGNQIFKSTGFGYGLHFANNIWAYVL